MPAGMTMADTMLTLTNQPNLSRSKVGAGVDGSIILKSWR